MGEQDFANLVGCALRTYRQQRQAVTAQLDGVVERAPELYRAVLDDDFTIQGVLNTVQGGRKIEHWDRLPVETQDSLEILGVRYPQQLQPAAVSQSLAEAMAKYLHEQGMPLTEEQAVVFPRIMDEAMDALQQAGVQFHNDVRAAYLPGLRQLAVYKDWLVTDAQSFMEFGKYEAELLFTAKATEAAQNMLLTVLRAGEKIKVDYGLHSKIFEDLIQVRIVSNHFDTTASPFEVAYMTKAGKQGKIDVLRAYISSIDDESELQRMHRIFYDKEFASDSLSPLLAGSEIQALVGSSSNLVQELQVGVWRKHLGNLGVDFTQPPEAILLDPSDREKITFFYPTYNRKREDNGVMVAFTFSERYGDGHAYACSREHFARKVTDAKQVCNFDEDYIPLIEQTAPSVHDYLKNHLRLTQRRY